MIILNNLTKSHLISLIIDYGESQSLEKSERNALLRRIIQEIHMLFPDDKKRLSLEEAVAKLETAVSELKFRL